MFPHFVLDRGKPGLIAVDGQGRRFVNEATTYHRFAEAMYAAHAQAPTIPCFFVCDDRFHRALRPGHGAAAAPQPAPRDRRRLCRSRATRLGALARLLAIDPAALEQTVARYNDLAASGQDLDFGKGGDAYQRNLGDPAHGPNPCMGPIRTPPFYAIRVYPGDIGASCGLETNEHAPR